MLLLPSEGLSMSVFAYHPRVSTFGGNGLQGVIGQLKLIGADLEGDKKADSVPESEQSTAKSTVPEGCLCRFYQVACPVHPTL